MGFDAHFDVDASFGIDAAPMQRQDFVRACIHVTARKTTLGALSQGATYPLALTTVTLHGASATTLSATAGIRLRPMRFAGAAPMTM